jgi:16S rRNA (guanine966-N2)-methyltransferase
MRIISGKYKGKIINSPQDYDIRPTSDRTRSALFNILCHGKLKSAGISDKPNFSELTVIDVFAGTGALGLEALSRGAKKVVFIEKSRKSINLLRKNINSLKAKNDCSIINKDATNLDKSNIKANVIFADPPYQKELVEPTIKSLIKNNWIADNAIVIIETEANEIFSLPEEFELLDSRKYGKAKINIFKFEKNNNA